VYILRDSGAKVVFGATRENRGAAPNRPSLPSRRLEHVCGFELDAGDGRSFAALLSKGKAADQGANRQAVAR